MQAGGGLSPGRGGRRLLVDSASISASKMHHEYGDQHEKGDQHAKREDQRQDVPRHHQFTRPNSCGASAIIMTDYDGAGGC